MKDYSINYCQHPCKVFYLIYFNSGSISKSFKKYSLEGFYLIHSLFIGSRSKHSKAIVRGFLGFIKEIHNKEGKWMTLENWRKALETFLKDWKGRDEVVGALGVGVTLQDILPNDLI